MVKKTIGRGGETLYFETVMTSGSAAFARTEKLRNQGYKAAVVIISKNRHAVYKSRKKFRKATAPKHITVRGKKYRLTMIVLRPLAKEERAMLVRRGYDVRLRLVEKHPKKTGLYQDKVAVYRSVKKVRKACPHHHHWSAKKRKCIPDRLYDDGYGGRAAWYELPS